MQVFQMVSVHNSHIAKLDIKNYLCCSKNSKNKKESETKHSWLSGTNF